MQGAKICAIYLNWINLYIASQLYLFYANFLYRYFYNIFFPYIIWLDECNFNWILYIIVHDWFCRSMLLCVWYYCAMHFINAHQLLLSFDLVADACNNFKEVYNNMQSVVSKLLVLELYSICSSAFLTSYHYYTKKVNYVC